MLMDMKTALSRYSVALGKAWKWPARKEVVKQCLDPDRCRLPHLQKGLRTEGNALLNKTAAMI
jgi:hypothetical protein